jgi:hypothetical protein
MYFPATRETEPSQCNVWLAMNGLLQFRRIAKGEISSDRKPFSCLVNPEIQIDFVSAIENAKF